jgi:hypothetical protein
MKNFTQNFIGLLALVFAMSFTVNSQEIGDIYQGGYIFQINEDGTGLVANLEDLGQMTWDEAVSSTSIYTSENYGDWRLPNIDELVLIYNSIANIPECNFITNKYYWSSTEENNNRAFTVNFTSGNVAHLQKSVSSIRVRPIRSVTFGEDENTEDSYLDLPIGWSMFGYTCLDSVDAMEGFAEISDKIEIVKDEWGLSYLPSWDFNAMGSLEFSEGYQIKMIEEVTDFEFCESVSDELLIDLSNMQQELNDNTDYYQNQLNVQQGNYEGLLSEQMMSSDSICNINLVATDSMYGETISLLELNYLTLQESSDSLIEVFAIQVQNLEDSIVEITPEDGIGQADVDAAVADLEASYAGWCASDIDNDGICDVDEVSGCMDASSCNYVSAAEFDDGSCDYVSCLDECGVINGDNSTCLDCAGVVNGTSEDLGCGCGNPAAQEGYDCDGNEIELQIGDIHEGGIVFQINEDGTGLVADYWDLGQMTWYDAIDAAASATSQGYDDWYLPSIEELELMYNTIGQGADNTGYFEYDLYWSSSEFNFYYAWLVYFSNGLTYYDNSKDDSNRVRVVRAF